VKALGKLTYFIILDSDEVTLITKRTTPQPLTGNDDREALVDKITEPTETIKMKL